MMIVNRAKEIVDQAMPPGEIVNIKALAQQLGLAYNTMYNLYHGRGNRIDYETLDKFCGVFNVLPGDVLIRKTDDKKTKLGTATTALATGVTE